MSNQLDLSLPAMAYYFLGLDNPTPMNRDSWSEGITDIFKPDDTLVVLNKLDLLQSAEPGYLEVDVLQSKCEGAAMCVMSCKTGEGVDVFMGQLEKMLKKMYAN